MPLKIGRRLVGVDSPLYVVAELGLNHGGSVHRALRLVDAAAEAGASAIKLQSFRADRFVAPSCPAPSHLAVESMRHFFKGFELDVAAHRAVAERARSRGLGLMATPFDERMVDLLEEIGFDAYKIASGDISHGRLIDRVARTGKPVLISTGMSDLEDVRFALACARAAGSSPVVLLHCVSAYPVPQGSENLRAISELARVFGVPVGLSDHGSDSAAVPLAVALGAVVYERHLMLDPADGGADAAVSVTPAGLSAIVRAAARAQQALGTGRKACLAAEVANVLPSRRGLYAARDLQAGERLTPEAIVALRPAQGLDPRRWSDIVARPLARSVRAGEPLLEGDLLGAGAAGGPS